MVKSCDNFKMSSTSNTYFKFKFSVFTLSFALVVSGMKGVSIRLWDRRQEGDVLNAAHQAMDQGASPVKNICV